MVACNNASRRFSSSRSKEYPAISASSVKKASWVRPWPSRNGGIALTEVMNRAPFTANSSWLNPITYLSRLSWANSACSRRPGAPYGRRGFRRSCVGPSWVSPTTGREIQWLTHSINPLTFKRCPAWRRRRVRMAAAVRTQRSICFTGGKLPRRSAAAGRLLRSFLKTRIVAGVGALSSDIVVAGTG
jgi:hypothetical protein